MRGEVYRLPARGTGHEQRGPRYAVVLQPDWLTLSTWVVAFTSTSARETSFRPPVEINRQRTLVMCDQIATVDVNRLAEPAGFLTLDEMQRVDEALSLVLDL
ncbi:mRNA interferase MazF [Blastococcus sp. DSM 46786]|uniref:type II toxin-antitoxin system PemK/MazF family toxin n=1 Tax=Blastococcus sp. DSM 46786 TaxID=1798227 RepID=UPI0008D022D4|nr:type II toxin-antitoxin system PemK/MazF family toxin [Blastococcus sp. DSM 46786]SEL82938.1 mRNA interferase MazF [Blastococcus sp. DSM 46786]